MMVWNMYLVLNKAIFGIYVKFLGCKKGQNHVEQDWMNNFLHSISLMTGFSLGGSSRDL